MISVLTAVGKAVKGLFIDKKEYNYQYLQGLKSVMQDGVDLPDRTGTGRRSIVGLQIRIDLEKEIPVMMLRDAPIKSPCREMRGFLKGFTNSNDFAEAGCKYWHKNANQNKAWLENPFRKGDGDLGPIYGEQWINWQGYKLISNQDITQALCDKLGDEGWKLVDGLSADGEDKQLWRKSINQFAEAVYELIYNPDSRQTLYHGWNPSVLNEIALPACHVMYHFIRHGKKLKLCTYQRSADYILGVPSNALQAAWLQKIVALFTDTVASELVMTFGDAHVYENLKEAAEIIMDQPVHKNKAYFDYRLDEGVHRDYRDQFFTARNILLADVKRIPEHRMPRLEAIELIAKTFQDLPNDWYEVKDYKPGIKISSDILPMAV